MTLDQQIQIWVAVSTFLAVIVALGGFWHASCENKKRRKFDKEQIYFDENIFKTTIPIQPLMAKDFINKIDLGGITPLWNRFDIYLKISSKNGDSWKYNGLVIFKDASKLMKNTPEYKEYDFLEVKDEEKSYPLGYSSKRSCIESALERYNAEIIY